MMGRTLDVLTSGSKEGMSIKHFYDNWRRRWEGPVPKKNRKQLALEDATDILTAGSELWMIGGTDAEGKIEGGGLSMGRVDSF